MVLFLYYSVMASMKYRDRDNGVTRLPILVDATLHETRDGRVIDLDGRDIAVRIFPPDATEGLYDPKRRTQIDKEFNQAFKRVSEAARNELLAIYILAVAIRRQSREGLQQYAKLKVGAEANRAKEMAKLLAELGEPTKVEASEKKEALEKAVAEWRGRLRYPISELSRELNKLVRGVRFVLWWVERTKNFAPGLYCDSASAALATALFSSIVSPQGLGICERCGNWFPRVKQDQRFCSLRCGNADRKARERERATNRKTKIKAR